jgi:hypothetical protein
MKQEAPQQRHSRTGIPAIHGGEHVNTYDRLLCAARCAVSQGRNSLSKVHPRSDKERVAAWVTNPSTCRRRR